MKRVKVTFKLKVPKSLRKHRLESGSFELTDVYFPLPGGKWVVVIRSAGS